MGKVLAAIVLVLAIAAGVVYGVPSVRAKVVGVPLKMQFRQGQEAKMKMNLDGKVKLEVTGLPPNMVPAQVSAFFGTDIPFKIEVRTKQLVKGVTGDEAEIETTMEGGSLEVTLPTGPFKQPIPAGAPSTMKMDSKGHVKFEAGAASPPGVPAEEMKKVQDFIGSMAGAFLSGQTRRVGQTWSTDINLPLTFDKAKVTVTGKISSTFAGVDKKSNVTVADIATDQNVTLDAAMTAPPGPGMPDVKLNGKINFKGHGYFDWSAGQVVGTDGNGNLDFNLKVKADRGPGGMPPTPIDATAHLMGSIKVSAEKL